MLDSIISGDRNISVLNWGNKNRIDTKFSKALKNALNEPDDVPYLIDMIMKEFKKLPKPAKSAVQNALVRVQIYCSIHGNSDPIKLSKQLYISQTLEKLMFGMNLIMETSGEEE